MAGGCVLSDRQLAKLHMRGRRIIHGIPRIYSVNIEKPHFAHLGQMKHFRNCGRLNCRRSLISEFFGIGSLPCAKAVQHD